MADEILALLMSLAPELVELAKKLRCRLEGSEERRFASAHLS